MINNLIEIAGLPGVGKTTLIERHRQALEQKYKIIESRHPTICKKIKAKGFLHLWLRWVIKDYNFAKALAYRLSFRHGCQKLPVLFYDSGLIQLLLERLIEHGASEIEDIIPVLKKVSLPSYLIYLTDDIDRIMGREMGRSPRRFQSPEQELAKRYKAAEELLKSRVFPLIRTVHIVNIKTEKDFLEKLGA